MPLTRSGFIAIPPGPRAGFDHADIYLPSFGAARLYVAHTGADRVDVIDCRAGAYLRALPGHPGVAGVIKAGYDLALWAWARRLPLPAGSGAPSE